MKPGVVLDPATGAPRVEAIRSSDGKLVFGYYTVRSGGMCVLVDVPPEALSGRRSDESDATRLHADLRAATEAVVRILASGDSEQEAEAEGAAAVDSTVAARVDALEERLSERDVDLARTRDALAEAESGREAAEQRQVELENELTELREKPPAPARKRSRAAA